MIAETEDAGVDDDATHLRQPTQTRAQPRLAFGGGLSVASALPKGLRWCQRRTSLRPLPLSGGV
jgi:hypothetical protein